MLWRVLQMTLQMNENSEIMDWKIDSRLIELHTFWYTLFSDQLKSLYCWGSKFSIWTKPIESWPKSGKQARWRQLIRKWEDKRMMVNQENTFQFVSQSLEVFKLGQDRRKRNWKSGHHWKEEKRKQGHVERWGGAWDSLEDAESLGRSLSVFSKAEQKNNSNT